MTPLRFLAAFAVFCFHFRALFRQSGAASLTHLIIQGPEGVSFFFVLSGFVLTWSHRPGDTSRRFWRRRFARIYPLQFVSWASIGLILVFLLRSVPQRGPALASLLLLSPWTPSQRYINAMNVPCWSLGCEAFFYLLFPVVYRSLQNRPLRDRRMLLLASLLGPVVLASIFRHADTSFTQYWFIYYFPPVRLLEFVAGMLLALEVRAGTWPRIPVKWAAGLALGVYIADGWAPISFMVVAVMFVPFVVLIGSLAGQEVTQGPGFLARPTLLRLGAWSYAFYLFHAPVLVVFAHFRHGPMGDWSTLAMAVAALTVAIAAAGLAYRYVERPAERAIREPGWRVPALTTGCAMALAFLLGAPVAYAVARQQVPDVTKSTHLAAASSPSTTASHTTTTSSHQSLGGPPAPGSDYSSPSPPASGPVGVSPSNTGASSPTTAVMGCQIALPLGLSTCGGTLVVVAPSRLCQVYRCDGDPVIDTGYLVECADGRVSMAGGRPGACADAGGVKSPLYLPAPSVSSPTTPATTTPTGPSTVTAPAPVRRVTTPTTVPSVVTTPDPVPSGTVAPF